MSKFLNLNRERNLYTGGVHIALIAVVVVFIQSLSPVEAKLSENYTGAELPSFADAVEKVAPAVVNISVSGQHRAGMRTPPQFSFPPGSPFEEFFKRHFRNPGRQAEPHRPRRFQGQGSGFIVDPDGLVVTNYHVIRNAGEITVITHDGAEYEAEVKGIDEKTDLALLGVEPDHDLPFVDFGDSDQVRVGDWVLAIGNPFGLGGTATTGIVSARGRNIRSGPLDDFLQIDAPINRGNSGGPLFNTRGEVVGVNTAIFSPNGGNIGIGFAIPSNMVNNVVAQLDRNGFVERGWLGVYIQTITEDLADSIGRSDTDGALITSVVEDSPAERAGLRPGDVVLSYDEQAVETIRNLPRLVAATAPGDEVEMSIWRDGTRVGMRVTVSKTRDGEKLASSEDASTGRERLGLSLEDLTAENRRQYGIDDPVNGVVVVSVEPDSLAFEKGLRNGDVIKQIGGIRVDDVEAAIEAVKKNERSGKGSVLLLVGRGGRDRFVAVKFA